MGTDDTPVYGDRPVAVEPGRVETVSDLDRHGRAHQLFWTWASPNLEFTTVFIGVLAVSGFGLGFWRACLAMAVGNLLGSAVLSSRGPDLDVPQMALDGEPP